MRVFVAKVVCVVRERYIYYIYMYIEKQGEKRIHIR